MQVKELMVGVSSVTKFCHNVWYMIAFIVLCFLIPSFVVVLCVYILVGVLNIVIVVTLQDRNHGRTFKKSILRHLRVGVDHFRPQSVISLQAI